MNPRFLIPLWLSLVLALCLARPAGAICVDALKTVAGDSVEETWKPSSPQLDEWVKIGVDRALGPESHGLFPPSLRQVSRLEYARNQVFFGLFKLMRFFTGRKNESGEVDFLRAIESTQKLVKRLRLDFLLKGSIWNRLEAMLAHPAVRNSDQQVGIGAVTEFHKEFLSDIAADKAKYGEAFFDTETVAQGAINSFAIKLFARLNTRSDVWDRSAVNAIALLHPIVDSAMDKGLMGKATMGKLAAYLESRTAPQIETAHERLLFDYLARFEHAFPRDKSPGFWFSLQRLFSAQIESLKQKGQDLPPGEYYRISLDKGGLSTVLAAYTGLGPLSEKEYEFFYRSGGVFQLVDDMLDIKKDQAEGVKTEWTNARAQGKSLAGPMKALLKLENLIEQELPRASSDFLDPAAFQAVYSFSFKLSLFRALARQKDQKDPELHHLFKGRHSLPLSAIQTLMAPPAPTKLAPEGSDLWLLQQLIEMTDSY